MNFTFGIITTGNNDNYINRIIHSIENNKIPNYEIIIVGNTNIKGNNKTKCYTFDETIKEGWITRKKNIISKNAKYENIVFIHDYVEFNNDWYEGFLKFGNNFEFCINKIINANGARFRDYSLFPAKVDYLNIDYSPDDIHPYFGDNCLLPYNFINNLKTNKYMYVSGSYYVIKKKISNMFLLDENLVWGRGEDVEYSKRLHNNGIIIQCNQYSSFKLIKYKHSAHWEREINKQMLQVYVDYCKNN